MSDEPRPPGFAGIRYEHLCPRAVRLQILVDYRRGDLGRAARLLQNAEDNFSASIPRYRTELVASRDLLDGQRARLASHVAHCTAGCKRATSGPTFVGEARAGMWSRSPSHAKTPLPGPGALAAMIAAGQTVQGLGLVYDRHPATVAQKLIRAGYSSITGKLINNLRAPDREHEPLPIQYPPWMDDALCAQTDPEAFFPEKGGSTREAKRICARCPVRAECLERALANAERFGILGGYSERERRKIARSRPDDEEVA